MYPLLSIALKQLRTRSLKQKIIIIIIAAEAFVLSQLHRAQGGRARGSSPGSGL